MLWKPIFTLFTFCWLARADFTADANALVANPKTIRLDPLLRRALLKALNELEQEAQEKAQIEEEQARHAQPENTQPTDEQSVNVNFQSASVNVQDVNEQIRQEEIQNTAGSSYPTPSPLAIQETNLPVLDSSGTTIAPEETTIHPDVNTVPPVTIQDTFFFQTPTPLEGDKAKIFKAPELDIETNLISDDKDVKEGRKEVTSQRPAISQATARVTPADNDVDIFKAPLVAAFTLHQDSRGTPHSIIPIYKQELQKLKQQQTQQNQFQQQAQPQQQQLVQAQPLLQQQFQQQVQQAQNQQFQQQVQQPQNQQLQFQQQAQQTQSQQPQFQQLVQQSQNQQPQFQQQAQQPQNQQPQFQQQAQQSQNQQPQFQQQIQPQQYQQQVQQQQFQQLLQPQQSQSFQQQSAQPQFQQQSVQPQFQQQVQQPQFQQFQQAPQFRQQQFLVQQNQGNFGFSQQVSNQFRLPQNQLISNQQFAIQQAPIVSQFSQSFQPSVGPFGSSIVPQQSAATQFDISQGQQQLPSVQPAIAFLQQQQPASSVTITPLSQPQILNSALTFSSSTAFPPITSNSIVSSQNPVSSTPNPSQDLATTVRPITGFSTSTPVTTFTIPAVTLPLQNEQRFQSPIVVQQPSEQTRNQNQEQQVRQQQQLAEQNRIRQLDEQARFRQQEQLNRQRELELRTLAGQGPDQLRAQRQQPPNLTFQRSIGFAFNPNPFQQFQQTNHRVNRQEGFGSTGNFGFNSEYRTIPDSIYRQSAFRSPQQHLTQLLYQSGVGVGPAHEDLNIVSKVLALNHERSDSGIDEKERKFASPNLSQPINVPALTSGFEPISRSDPEGESQRSERSADEKSLLVGEIKDYTGGR